MPREEDSHTLRRPGSGRCEPLEETLLPGLELGRNQADSVDTGAAHNVDGAGHFHEQNVVVALDERNFLGALLEDRFETRTKAIPGRVLKRSSRSAPRKLRSSRATTTFCRRAP